MIKSLPEAKISPDEFSTVHLVPLRTAKKVLAEMCTVTLWPAVDSFVLAANELSGFYCAGWISGRPVGSGHEGSGVLAEHGGESGQGAAPAGGAVLAFQPADQ